MMVERYHQCSVPDIENDRQFLNRTAGTGDAVLPGLHGLARSCLLSGVPDFPSDRPRWVISMKLSAISIPSC